MSSSTCFTGVSSSLKGVISCFTPPVSFLTPFRMAFLHFVVLLRLERGGAHVDNLHRLALRGVRLARSAVTGGALGLPQTVGLFVCVGECRDVEQK